MRLPVFIAGRKALDRMQGPLRALEAGGFGGTPPKAQGFRGQGSGCREASDSLIIT
jgi:hypothetical protein